jgi:hypothetical protein
MEGGGHLVARNTGKDDGLLALGAWNLHAGVRVCVLNVLPARGAGIFVLAHIPTR